MPEGTIGTSMLDQIKINDIGLEVKNRKAAIIWLIIQKERENSTTQESHPEDIGGYVIMPKS